MWTTKKAIALSKQLELIAPSHGGHVALTGGTLYKDGDRKDVDILIYRIRQVARFRWDTFFKDIEGTLGIKLVQDFGWNKKAVTASGEKIDFFDPDYTGGEEGDDYP